MTNEELDALEKLCDGASKAPWTVERLGRYEDHDEVYINLQDDDMELADRIVSGTNYENADFITAARTAMPALISEVRRLQAEIDRNAVFLAAHGIYSFEPAKANP